MERSNNGSSRSSSSLPARSGRRRPPVQSPSPSPSPKRRKRGEVSPQRRSPSQRRGFGPNYKVSPQRRTPSPRRGFGRSYEGRYSPGRRSPSPRQSWYSPPRRGRRSPPTRRGFDGRDAPEPCEVLGVFGLNSVTEEDELARVFNRYAEVARVEVVRDRETGRSRGFAFVTFRDVKSAKTAKEMLVGKEIDGTVPRIDYSVTRHGGPGRHDTHRSPRREVLSPVRRQRRRSSSGSSRSPSR